MSGMLRSGARRRLGLWLGAVLSLSLALAGALALFAVVDGTLLNPLPYPQQERIVRILREQGPQRVGPPVSGPVFLDLAREQDVFSAFAAQGFGSQVMTGTGAAERLAVAKLSQQWFEVIGLKPTSGRWFAAGDFEGGAEPVAVLSQVAWRDRFGAASNVVGSRVILDGQSHTIIGVAPKELLLPGRADLAVPLILPAGGGNRGESKLILAARLADGVSLSQAQARLDALSRGLAAEFPDQHSEMQLRARLMGEMDVESTTGVVRLVAAAIALLLLVGAASLSNLVLADAQARRREFATRIALGAPPRRLLLQLLGESMRLVGAAAVVGVLLGAGALQVLKAAKPNWIARPEGIGIGGLPLSALAALTLLLGLFSAWIVARSLLRQPGSDAMRLNVRSVTLDRGRQRLRRGLVVVQIALSLALLVGAGLLTTSLSRVLAEDPGFDPQGLWAGHVTLGPEFRPQDKDPADDARRTARKVTVLAQIEAAARALPGVIEAGVVFRLPIMDGPGTNGGVTVVGDEQAVVGRTPQAEVQIASPAYFRTLGLGLKEGRMFPELGTPAGDVVLVNNTLAERLFAGRQALGARIVMADNREREIVGIVQDVRQGGLDAEVRPEVYFPWDAVDIGQQLVLAVRTQGDPAALTGAIREAIAAIDPTIPLHGVQTMDEAIAAKTGQRRFLMTMMLFFAATALAIAVVGLYALASNAVAQRTPEFGVRSALGASPRSLARLVAVEGARLVGLGLVLGLLAAGALAFALRGSLYGVEAGDPGVYLTVSAVLALAAALALLPSAVRAGRIAPIEALREG